jgi:hypothetical protein
MPGDGCPLTDRQSPSPGGAATLAAQAAQGDGMGVLLHGEGGYHALKHDQTFFLDTMF